MKLHCPHPLRAVFREVFLAAVQTALGLWVWSGADMYELIPLCLKAAERTYPKNIP